MKTAAKVAAVSVLVLLTLTGCFKGKVDLSLNSDNTIDGTMLIAIQSGIGESFGSSDEEILGELTGDVGSDLEGATSEDYSEEGFIGKKYTFKNQPLDAFSSGDDGSDISITREGDSFVVDGAWDTDDTDTGGVDLTSLGAEFTFAVTFPGKVSDHNGELSNDGHTVTWNLLDPPATLHAEGGATTGGSPWAWLVIGLGVLIIAAVVVVVVVRSRGKKTAAEAALPAAAAPALASEAPAGAPTAATADAPVDSTPEAAPDAPTDTPDAP